MNEKNTFVAWLGYNGTPDFLKSRTIGSFVGVVILLFTLTVFAFAAIGLVKALSLYAFGDSTEDPSAAIRNIGLLLVGLLGAPFVAWQAIVRQKQVDIADNVLFNDKLNDANNDLHARYQTSEKQKNGTYIDVWKDDIIRRNGAIDRLEALAIERPAMAPRIARILCVYLKEMTADHRAEVMPLTLSKEERRNWPKYLRIERSDMETAAQVLGRLHELTQVSAKDLAIDLTRVNLQAMQLSDLNFEQAKLERADLDGANLNGAKLNGANLNGAKLNGAELNGAELNTAELSGAELNWALLNWAELNGAELNAARLNGAQLQNAKLENTWLYDAELCGAVLSHAILDEASLVAANLKQATLKHTQLPEASLYAAKLHEANFSHSNLTGTNLDKAEVSEYTSFGRTISKGAALKSIDLSQNLDAGVLIKAAFGDASVILPDEYKAWAEQRWPNARLEGPEYKKEWELFKRDPEAYVPPQHRKA